MNQLTEQEEIKIKTAIVKRIRPLIETHPSFFGLDPVIINNQVMEAVEEVFGVMCQVLDIENWGPPGKGSGIKKDK